MDKSSELAVIRWADHYPILAVLVVMFVLSHAVIAWQFWYHAGHIDNHIDALEARVKTIEMRLIYAGQKRAHP